MKKIILYVLLLIASTSLIAMPQEDFISYQEQEESAIPNIKFEDISVTAECVSETAVKYCFDIKLCGIYTPVNDFEIYISPVPGNDWQYAGTATQVGSDDFHFELCFISSEVLDPGAWVITGYYDFVNPDDIWPGNGNEYCSSRRLFNMPEPEGDCGGCEVDLVVTDGGVDITETLETEMPCGDNCVEIEVSNMEITSATASEIMLSDGFGLFCNPNDDVDSFEVYIEGVDDCGNNVNLTINVRVEQNCDECPYIDEAFIWGGEWINTSGPSAGNYTDYSGEICIPMIDANIPQLNISSSVADMYYGIFIDLNGDGDFDDPEEVLFNDFVIGDGVGSSFSDIMGLLQGGELVRFVVSTVPIDPLVVPECGEMEDYVVCGGPDCSDVEAHPEFTWEADCLEVTFTDVSQVTGGIFVGQTLWDFGYSDTNGPVTGGTQAGGTITHTFPAAGEYTVCITIQVFTANGDCCHYDYCEVIEVSEGCGCIPEPTIEVNPGLCPVPCCFIGTFTNNASYAPTTVYWIWGDGTQTIIENDPYDPNFDAFDAFHTYTSSGNFTVQVFALYHPEGPQGVCCGVFSNEDKANCGGGGSDGTRKNAVTDSPENLIKGLVSPNPLSMSNNQVFYLDIENKSNSQVNMQLMDMNGRVVYEQLELSDESTNMIQLDSRLAPGIYLVRLFDGTDNVQNIKLLVTE